MIMNIEGIPAVKCSMQDKVVSVGRTVEQLADISRRNKGYGLCATCGHFIVRKTQLFDEEAWCGAYINKYIPCIRPRLHDPIIECSQYYPTGQLSLMEMTAIATIIDVAQIKNSAGFIDQEEKFKVTIKTPQEE